MMKWIFLFKLVLVSAMTFGQAKLFEPEMVSDNQAFGLTISPNGKELFYVKSFGGRDTLQIFYSQKINGKWQKPTLAPFADRGYRQIDPAFSPDGQIVLFNSLSNTDSSFDIFFSRKTQSGWSAPERFSDSINTTASDFYATVSKNKNIYFTRRVNSNDIYVSYYKNNQYLKAVPIDSTVNTVGNESNPYISPNEDYLIFFADYKEGFGETDLYISFRKDNKWSYPINLGSEINSKIGEFCPAIDFKNNLFLFSRTQVINGRRIENIYTYPLKQLGLERLRKLAKWK